MLLSATDRTGQARTMLARRGMAVEDLLPRFISESWQRCLIGGLDPQQPPPLLVADMSAVNMARERAALLRRLGVSEMENLYHQIAGTNYMVALAAPDGMLLDTICDSSFGETARVASIQPGTFWGEAHCGTNALGTVAATGLAVTVHGGEHFFDRYGSLTCTAVPVLAPDGMLAGVLDASSDCRSRQRHTHALVSMAAAQIENGLFRECHRRDIVVAFHSRAEFLYTVNVGLLAIDPDGLVLAVNARAGALLHSLPAVRGARFEALFRTGLAGVLQAGREGERQQLEDRVGSAYAARLENPPPRRGQPAHAQPAARPAILHALAPSGFVAQDAAVVGVLRQVEAAAAPAPSFR